MADPPVFDPADGLPVSPVGIWAEDEKHARLRRYVDAARAARRKYIGPKKAGAAYVDLFCGFGRSVVREDGRIIDGSPIVAHREATSRGVPFSALHVADSKRKKLETTTQRLERLGATVHPYLGPATETVHQVVGAVDPKGLHLVFLDPYNLADLPFSIIETLADGLQRMDLLVHVSTMDLQRNFRNTYLPSARCGLDVFCPGWREVVDATINDREARRRVLKLWVDRLCELGLTVYDDQIEAVYGKKKQRLYWLVFASRHRLAHKLWDEIRNLSPQRPLL